MPMYNGRTSVRHGLEYDYRGLQRVYRKLGETAKLQHYQTLFDEWHMQRQSLRFLEPTENEPIEPSFRSANPEVEQRLTPTETASEENEEEEEESALAQLLDEYRLEFGPTFGQSATAPGSSKVEPSSDSSPASPGRSVSPAPGGENSRSTGY
nr:unnamed protein product [Spirometra erinaceieuropaei]